MNNYLPTLQFLFNNVSRDGLLSWFNQASASEAEAEAPLAVSAVSAVSAAEAQQPAAKPNRQRARKKQPVRRKLLNFSIILKEEREREREREGEPIFAVKPIPIDQQDFLYDEKSKNCYTTVLIKRNIDNIYEFKFVKYKGANENQNNDMRKIHKIEKIIYRLNLFNILKHDEYILATIDCQNDRSSSNTRKHQDDTQGLINLCVNEYFYDDLRKEVPQPTYTMCEYKLPCMGAQYDYDETSFRCSIDQSQVLCFNNLLGEHGTPDILDDHEFREEGNNRVMEAKANEIDRKIERYHFSPLTEEFYDKYTEQNGMIVIPHDIRDISTRAFSIGNAGEKFVLSEYTEEIKERIESGGSKINKYKFKTKKYKFKTKKYKFKTNKYKK